MQGWDVSTMPRLSEGGQKHAGVGHLHPRVGSATFTPLLADTGPVATADVSAVLAVGWEQ